MAVFVLTKHCNIMHLLRVEKEEFHLMWQQQGRDLGRMELPKLEFGQSLTLAEYHILFKAPQAVRTSVLSVFTLEHWFKRTI